MKRILSTAKGPGTVLDDERTPNCPVDRRLSTCSNDANTASSELVSSVLRTYAHAPVRDPILLKGGLETAALADRSSTRVL